MPREQDKENRAIKQFQTITGRDPDTLELQQIYSSIYGTDLPQELRATEMADSSTPSKLISEAPRRGLQELRGEVEKGKQAVQQFSRPTSAINKLQEAIRLKTGAAKAPIGESAIFKQAGLKGFGALASSLSARRDEISTNFANFKNIISTMAGLYKDQANIAMFDYEQSVDAFNKELDRIDEINSDLRDHEQALELLNLKTDIDKELVDYKNRSLSAADKIDIYETFRNPQQVIDAIEGKMRTGTANRPQRNFNPGNIKIGGLGDQYAKKNEDGSPMVDDQNHLIFDGIEMGYRALFEDVRAKIEGRSKFITEPNPTIAELGKVYAEDPGWAQSVASILGVTPETRTHEVQFEMLLDAIAIQEGFYDALDVEVAPPAEPSEPFALKGEGKQLGETTVKMLSDGRTLPELLSNIEKKLGETDDFGFLKKPILQLFLGNLNIESRAALQAELKAAAQLVGRFMEGGVLRKEDEIKYEKMLPNVNDLTKGIGLAKLQVVKNMLAMQYRNYIVDFRASGYDVSGFPEEVNFGQDAKTDAALEGATLGDKEQKVFNTPDGKTFIFEDN